MSEQQTEEKFKLHPIQLTAIKVTELFIKIHRPIDAKQIEEQEVAVAHTHKKYDSEKHSIEVLAKVETGMEKDTKSAISMKIGLLAKFIVDESRFSKDHIDDWAKRNSIFILMPYLRENAYALTVRCGLPPAILPLLQVPTSRAISPPIESASKKC
jgi:preprotein translocase subunit SecB